MSQLKKGAIEDRIIPPSNAWTVSLKLVTDSKSTGRFKASTPEALKENCKISLPSTIVKDTAAFAEPGKSSSVASNSKRMVPTGSDSFKRVTYTPLQEIGEKVLDY